MASLADEKAKGKTCEATVGLLKEGDEIAADFKGWPALNAVLISPWREKASNQTLTKLALASSNAEALGVPAKRKRRAHRICDRPLS